MGSGTGAGSTTPPALQPEPQPTNQAGFNLLGLDSSELLKLAAVGLGGWFVGKNFGKKK